MTYTSYYPHYYDEKIRQFYAEKLVLITGGAGFIGSYIATDAVYLGAQVTILDNLSTGHLDNIHHIQNKVKLIHGDITNYDTCIAATHGKAIIFHLAAMTSVPASLLTPLSCYQNNVLGTATLLEAARAHGHHPTFVFSSSAAVYGPYTTPCSETIPCHPISPYGSSKLLGELLCKQYSTTGSIPSAILRYFNVYGEGQRGDVPHAGVIAQLQHRMARNQPITIYGDGQQIRDFVPVDYISSANILLGMMGENMHGEIFNIATGRPLSLRAVITRLCQQFPHYPPELISFGNTRPGDIHYSAANCSKYQALLSQNHYDSNIQKLRPFSTIL